MHVPDRSATACLAADTAQTPLTNFCIARMAQLASDWLTSL